MTENLSAILCPQGLLISTSQAKKAGKYANITTALTLSIPAKVGPNRIIKCYDAARFGRSECLRLPRGIDMPLNICSKFAPIAQGVTHRSTSAAIDAKGVTHCHVIRPEGMTSGHTDHSVPTDLPSLHVTLTKNQQIVITECLKQLSLPRGSALLDMRAGQGKTFVAAGIVSRLNVRRVLYVCINKFLLSQATTDLDMCFGKGHKVEFIVINSALKRDKEFFAQFDLVIFDEAHALSSTARRGIFNLCSTPLMFGMSATLYSKPEYQVVRWELGPIITAACLPGYDTTVDTFDLTVHAVKYYGSDGLCANVVHPSTGMLSAQLTIEQVLRDQPRMEYVIRTIQSLLSWRGEQGQTHTIIVFSEYLDPLKALHHKLLSARIDAEMDVGDELDRVEGAGIGTDDPLSHLCFNQCQRDDIMTITGGAKAAAMTEARKSARVILTTYGYMGTGASIQRATCAILYTSRYANMIQIIGRILRRGSDARVMRHVYDIVDARTALCTQHKKRLPAYEYYGAWIVTERVRAEK